MDVIFHVLVDTSLLQDGTHFQGLVLNLNSSSKEEKHRLRAEDSYNDEKYTELTTRASLNVEKYQYKYIFSLSDDEIQEYRNAGVRFFNVSTKKPRDGIYHQYDGVIRLESNRRFYQLPLTPIKNDAKISAQLFVKKIKISSSRNNFNGLMGEDLISELNFIFSSMTESYCMIYETDIMHMIRKAVITVFQQTVDDITVGYTNTEHTQNIFINAMTIAYCLADGLIELTDVEKGYICMRLLPRIDKQFDGCADITALKCAFKKTPTEKLVLVLHNILKAVTMKPGNPSWIYCMPLLHFLDGKCKIWETAPDDVSHKQSVPLWWGTVLGRNISLDLTAFKSSLYDNQMLTYIEEMLFQYSKADYLLPRAFMASVCFDQLSTVVKFRSIQPDVILAALCSFITTETQDNYSNNVEKNINNCLDVVIKKSKTLEESNRKSLEFVKCVRRCCSIACDVLQAFGKCKEVTDVSMHLIMQASFKFMHLLDLENVRAEKDLLKYRAHIRDLVLCVSNSAKQRLHLKFMLGKSHRYTELFRTFNLMLSSAKNDGYVRECFISNLKDSIFEMLKTDEQKDMNLVMAFCDRKENYCNILTDILNDMIVEAAEKNIDQLKSQELSESRIIRLGHIFSQLFKQRIERNHAQTEAEILQLMVTWKHMPVCMKLLEKNKENDQDCKDQLHKIQPVLDKTLQELFSGQIVISNLHLIINHIDIVLEILKEMSAEVDEHNVTRSIEKNLDALESFDRTKKLLKKFVELCQLFEVNTKDIDDNIDKFKDLNSFQLSELCKIKTARGVEPVFTVVAFMFKEADMQKIADIVSYCDGYFFIRLWDKYGKCAVQKKKKALTIQEVLTSVLESAMGEWRNLQRRFESGQILCREFEAMYREFDRETAKKELEFFQEGKTSHWIDDRLRQIKLYWEISRYKKAAVLITEIKESFELEGDFSSVQSILQFVQERDVEMALLDNSVVDVCRSFASIDDRKLECLRSFKDSKSLVVWLRSEMKKDELKIFVDLAYNSTGDSIIDINRVTTLRAAVTGYASLIFDMKNNCDYEQFLHLCKDVWRAQASNPILPKQLIDTCCNLLWLQKVQSSHGSVHKNATSEAKRINKIGTYTIGNPFYLQKIELQDVLQLTIEEEGEQEQKRKLYTLSDLNDLQSRLMLIGSTEETEDIDRFLEIFDALKILGTMFINILNSGCVLFSNFQVEFRCDKKSAVCVFLSFGEKNDKRIIRGRRSTKDQDDCLFVRKIADFLGKCLDEWDAFVDAQREEHYLLNYFSMKQLVFLQCELAKLGTDQEPSAKLYPLLSAIKKDCNREDVVTSLRNARSELIQIESKERTIAQKPKIEKSKEDIVAIFIKEMIISNFSESLALEALKHVKPENITDGIVWCIEHQDDHEEKAPELIDEENFPDWIRRDATLFSVTSRSLELGDIMKGVDLSKEKAMKNLADLWRGFLTSVTSSVSDFLSVGHTALILKLLSQKDTRTVNRSFAHCGCEVGVPNLLICPQNEMYTTVLSIYCEDKTAPLPQADEILLCTKDTKFDIIETFWRRAFYSKSQSIYCLVNVDLLDYEVSDKAEVSLDRHMQSANQKGIPYQLVVLCSSKNEFKSRLVAAIDSYRRPRFQVKNESFVKSYLSNQFRNKSNIVTSNQAMCVDFERSSVRVVKSFRAGLGKTLFVKNMKAALESKRREEQLSCKDKDVITIPIYGKCLLLDDVAEILLCQAQSSSSENGRILHIDIAYEVEEGVDLFLFQLIVLGCVTHKSGHVWRKSANDYFIIESMPLLDVSCITDTKQMKCVSQCLNIFPDIMCKSPDECLRILSNPDLPGSQATNLGFDDSIYNSEVFQRPYKYLCTLEKMNSENLNEKGDCLKTLTRFCGIPNPTWSELYHFATFLNVQLKDFETSDYCKDFVQEYLPGFKNFVLRFLIQMSKDFAMRSLNMSEESPNQMLQRGMKSETDIERMYDMRRTWETSPHPYLFFNNDHQTMTFLGFFIERTSYNLMDHQTKRILERNIMTGNLYTALNGHGVNLSEEFDHLKRGDKIRKLCTVMGIKEEYDPDPTYELTTDNVKKILAIYMRFRCDIPVIIMGETGSGKTRLVKFMCALQNKKSMAKDDHNVDSMIIMKVHGGTTVEDISKTVIRAEFKARQNAEKMPGIFTVLFFDETNTTEAIGAIKEIMCDKCLKGKPIELHERLKIVAACNPYRKHKDAVIKSMEEAGLGYRVKADDTKEKLGHVPMRHLVYKVQPLPQSMLPLVWDFGQLNTVVEEMYIRQMVLRTIKEEKVPCLRNIDIVLTKLLSECQKFMRNQKNECSFVSLRDVERVLDVTSWFKNYYKALFGMHINAETEVTRSLLLALRVCYESCLEDKKAFTDMISSYIQPPLVASTDLQSYISGCRDEFLKNVNISTNIARNRALKENVFLMIVCIENKIPMFLIGKPGSSKSLAKAIVAENMHGANSKEIFFKNFKEIQIVSYQCSPLSRPDSIIGTFKKAADLQKNQDPTSYVCVVVLDEIGLAEDSETMALKTLHSLLEEGCSTEGNDDPEMENKVAFIGISNWALDPAKMNRGIFVRRDTPDREELEETARGICATSTEVLAIIKTIIPNLAEGYMHLLKHESIQREYFGLRDFYSLIKMIYGFADTNKQELSWNQLKYAIMRNFGGLEGVDPVQVFRKHLNNVDPNEKLRVGDPDCTPANMIQDCLEGLQQIGDTRYLLLLVENYGDLSILQQKILTKRNAVVIFGSSFDKDQDYTQVCRNINRIKVCMETGTTAVLLNLEILYESLYDTMNQYYVECFGQKFIELGLGNHRVKCHVHKDFRLIVVALKETVAKEFQTPLINRLEKHVISLSTLLSSKQQLVLKKLNLWIHNFCQYSDEAGEAKRNGEKCQGISDVFVGIHSDSSAAVILQLYEDKRKRKHEFNDRLDEEVLKEAKHTLIWCTTPDTILTRDYDKLPEQKDELIQIYFKNQQHESLMQYIRVNKLGNMEALSLIQVTTHAKLFSTHDVFELCNMLSITRQNVALLSLQSFDTEQQFGRKIREVLAKQMDRSKLRLILVQCESGDQKGNLVACARYSIESEIKTLKKIDIKNLFVILIVQIPRVTGRYFTGFQCGTWHSVHIDELRAKDGMPHFIDMYKKPISAVLESYLHETETSGAQFDVISLIWSCIQKALASVKDVNEDSKRNIERVKLIFSLEERYGNLCTSKEGEPGRNQKSVMSGLAVHIIALLKEKEEYFDQHRWLSTETAKSIDIDRAGTYRKSVMQYLERQIISLLAGVLAIIDTNENLNMLSADMTTRWKSFLWRELINDPQATQIVVSDFENTQKTNAHFEFIVTGSSKEGKSFTSKMPFSWIICRKVGSLWKNCIRMPKVEGKGREYDKVLRTAAALKKMPIGKLISQLEKEDISEALRDYVSDFVQMTYPVKSNAEHQIVCHNVLIGCKAIMEAEFSQNILTSLIGCHAAFDINEKKFRNFEKIVQIWPDCSLKCVNFLQEKHYLVSDDEINLDLIGLYLLLGTVEEPNDENFQLHENRVKWITRLCQYRPVVERILDNQDSDNGRRRNKAIKESREIWTRAFVMKLFVEHVCTEDSAVGKCRPLWTIMKKSNVKTVESLGNVEKFLQAYKNSVASKLLSNEKCVHCESPYKDPPVSLPCKHSICRTCLNHAITQKAAVCPLCQHTFKPDFDQKEDGERLHHKQLKEFMGRCNSFFMEIVSQLCFAKGASPSSDVVNKLLHHITVTTTQELKISKKLTVFNDCIDGTPVVRSFLFQRLMQTSGPEVMQHLQTYFENALGLVQSATTDSSQVDNLYLLVLHCMEDRCFQQNPKLNITTVIEATQMLRDNFSNIRPEPTKLLDNIQKLSQTRFAISIAGNCLNAIYVENSMKSETIHQDLFDALLNLFGSCNCKWPKYFLIRYFCKSFGITSYQSLRNKCEIKSLIVAQELEQDYVEECCDRLTASDLNYPDIKSKFTKLISNEDAEQFNFFLKDITKDWRTESVLYLSIYREITMKWLQREETIFTEKARETAKKYLLQIDSNIDKGFVSRLLTNKVWTNCARLNISPEMDLHNQGLSLILLHFSVILRKIPGQKSYLEPLKNIATRPEKMKTAFLPTMPQDDLTEIYDALLKARTAGEQPQLYRCPNGHPYIIGNCGMPATVAFCMTCGKEIGGRAYTLAADNTKWEGTDRTEMGHILGDADHISGLFPERKLSNVSCGVLRLLTHLAMFLGSDFNLPAVTTMIHPYVKESDIASFLLKHIDNDVSSLSKTLGRSNDDILLFMHCLISFITSKNEKTGHDLNDQNHELCYLNTKDARYSWESDIDRHFIIPFLEGTEEVLQLSNNRIAKDGRLDKSQLSQLLFETSGHNIHISETSLYDNPSIWQYREHVSVEHLKLMIGRVRQTYPVLNIFLEEEHSLRPLRFVPNIMRLQKHLLQKYKRRLDKTEANNLKLKMVIEEFSKDEKSEELLECIDHFQQAWSMTKDFIQKDTFVVNKRIMQLKRELAETVIDDDTPVSFLLPSHTDQGFLSYILLYFLLQRQNLFLEKYRQSKSIGFHARPFVQVRDITSTHMISYHPDSDLLPIVLANCNYTFQVGEGTRLEYNFATLESQLIDRFLITKSDILLDDEDAIETMVYKSDSTNSVVFLALRTTIKQDKISHVVMGQIKNEMSRLQYPDLCDHIQNVDIAINFMKSLGRIEPGSSFNDFVVDTLQLDDPCLNQKLKMSNIQSLWITLSYEKTKRLQDVSKESFDGIPSRFKEHLTDDQRKFVTTYADKLPLQRLSVLVDLLYECIVLTINTPQKDEETVDMATISLDDAISQHIYDQPYENEQHADKWLTEIIVSLKKTPKGTDIILCSKCIDTWIGFYHVFRKNQKEN